MSLNKLPPLKNLIVEKNCSLKDTLKIIEQGGQRIAFVVSNKKLINVITDGDIRRAILKNIDLKWNSLDLFIIR